MNHHDFRIFVKDMPIEVLKHFNMNPAHFKSVCFTLSMYGTYESGNKIFPSWLTVAKEAGVDRKTAMKVRDFLLEHNIIVTIRKREKNISEYEFGQPSEQLSILINQLSNSDNQLSNLENQLSINSGHNTIIDTIKESIIETIIENPQEDFMDKELINNQKKVNSSFSLVYKDKEPSGSILVEPQLSNFGRVNEKESIEDVMDKYMTFGKI
jgi:DNA-binding transcriptional regulator YhcF (GntR family)